MSSSRKTKKAYKTLKISAICIIAFALGYFSLNHISTWERPRFGNTLYIVGGCVLMAVSSIVLLITLKNQFAPKKRRSSRHVFLEDKSRKSRSSRSAPKE
ncbi:hypothetical protein [Flavobacterium noncentrifugens]|uniref:Uncharacterized protein n=1 Tax=Flavobacterium noncentrifugens TaxID=1128970 RepID=A0A1G8WAN0_9FLAO|nr:hypothetical protein [Flavobacterium noncentrifugens]SDJ75127.1 hypothetical protein SAMN04487935_1718 [Flavobacterium noncentrifugens]